MKIAKSVVLGVLLAACGGGDANTDSSGGDSSTGPGTNTTLPPLTTTGIDTFPPADSSGSDGGSETNGDGTTAGATDSTGSTGSVSESSGGESGTSTGTTGGMNALVVEWCILQFPAAINAAPDDATTVYARLYVEGVTDQSQFVDEDPLVVSQFGYGADGSLPDDAWTWVAGTPNAGWDGTMAGGFGNENNDEYQGDLAISAAGTYDYAARFSADGGRTWAYCDLDDLQNGGYTVEQAGDAVIE